MMQEGFAENFFVLIHSKNLFLKQQNNFLNTSLGNRDAGCSIGPAVFFEIFLAKA
jgi:hypothetical protein